MSIDLLGIATDLLRIAASGFSETIGELLFSSLGAGEGNPG